MEKSITRLTGILSAHRRRFPRYRLLCLAFCLLTGCAQQAAYRRLDAALEHERHRETEPALKAFRAAVEIQPEDPYLRRELARAYLRRDMYDEAVAELEAVLQREPSYIDAYLDMAVAFGAQNMPEAAMGWLEKAIREVPDYPPPYKNLTDLYLSRDRPDEAMALLEKVVELIQYVGLYPIEPDTTLLGEDFDRIMQSHSARLIIVRLGGSLREPSL